jgi:hypothetical protein
MLKRISTRIEHWFNEPAVRARIIGILGAIFLTLANSGIALAQGPSGGLTGAIASLAKMLIDFIIALMAILLAIGIATNSITGMVEVGVGRPGGLSSTWMRIAGIILCFIVGIFSITIANTIIDSLKSYKSTGGISVP